MYYIIYVYIRNTQYLVLALGASCTVSISLGGTLCAHFSLKNAL